MNKKQPSDSAFHESIFHYQKKFELESGESFSELKIQYTTFGKLNSEKSNVVWVCHALTANSDPSDWWQGLVGENDLYNPEEHFIVCANVIGSAYGSTSPLNCESDKQFRNFPLITIRDLVKAWRLLKKDLGFSKIHTLIGGSIGGHQALEWAIQAPDEIENLVICASSAESSPWVTAFNQSQRLAIEADQSFTNDTADSASSGLKAARSIALLSYRNDQTYNSTQRDEFSLDKPLKSSTYQTYQGEKLVKRFNAYSYHSLTRTMDSHNVGRARGGVEQALKKVKAKTLIIGIRSDILFPLKDSERLAQEISNAKFVAIDSKFGHDGFLIETQQISKAITKFYSSQDQVSLFGLGCVGQGVYHLLNKNNKAHRVKHVFVKNPEKPRNGLTAQKLSQVQPSQLANLQTGQTIVELTDNSELSYLLYQKAVAEGKNFITANKKMVATHLDEIIHNNKNSTSSVLYEAAVAGSIPVIRHLDNHVHANEFESLQAILNGSSNYILTQMSSQGWSYQQALAEAQRQGFAESNPYSDVSGEDAKFKSIILTAHALGKVLETDAPLCLGIQNINSAAIEFAKQHQFEIKQMAQVQKLTETQIEVFVTPQFVPKDSEIGITSNENNIILIKNNETNQLLKGAGAGSVATGSAVISDFHASDKRYQYSFENNDSLELNYDRKLRVFVSKNHKAPAPNLGQILAEKDEYVLIETSLSKLKKHQDRLQEQHFVCLVP